MGEFHLPLFYHGFHVQVFVSLIFTLKSQILWQRISEATIGDSIVKTVSPTGEYFWNKTSWNPHPAFNNSRLVWYLRQVSWTESRYNL